MHHMPMWGREAMRSFDGPHWGFIRRVCTHRAKYVSSPCFRARELLPSGPPRARPNYEYLTHGSVILRRVCTTHTYVLRSREKLVIVYTHLGHPRLFCRLLAVLAPLEHHVMSVEDTLILKAQACAPLEGLRCKTVVSLGQCVYNKQISPTLRP